MSIYSPTALSACTADDCSLLRASFDQFAIFRCCCADDDAADAATHHAVSCTVFVHVSAIVDDSAGLREDGGIYRTITGRVRASPRTPLCIK